MFFGLRGLSGFAAVIILFLDTSLFHPWLSALRWLVLLLLGIVASVVGVLRILHTRCHFSIRVPLVPVGHAVYFRRAGWFSRAGWMLYGRVWFRSGRFGRVWSRSGRFWRVWFRSGRVGSACFVVSLFLGFVVVFLSPLRLLQTLLRPPLISAYGRRAHFCGRARFTLCGRAWYGVFPIPDGSGGILLGRLWISWLLLVAVQGRKTHFCGRAGSMLCRRA